MIKAVVALAQSNGQFPQVGMTDRTVMQGTVKSIRRKALLWAQDRRVQIEYHNGSVIIPAFRKEVW